MTDAQLITKATAFAVAAHGLTTRKGLNEPYVSHTTRVAAMAADIGLSADAIAAAHLHDVVEDTVFELADLDFPSRTVELVDLLTQTWDKNSPDRAYQAKEKLHYYRRIEGDAEASNLKLLDRVDNIKDMIRTAGQSPSMRKWATKYLAKTLAEFEGVKRSANSLQALDLFNSAVQELSAKLAELV